MFIWSCSGLFIPIVVVIKVLWRWFWTFFFLSSCWAPGRTRWICWLYWSYTYLRDSLTNIHIRVLSPGCPSLGRMPHSHYYFVGGGVYISLLCPPSTCVCMCAVNAGGCVIDLFVQGCASTSSLLCLVTGNNANTDNSPLATSPFCIPPHQAWRVAGGRWKISSDTLTLFRRTAPTGNRTRVASVIGQSVTTRPPRRNIKPLFEIVHPCPRLLCMWRFMTTVLKRKQ